MFRSRRGPDQVPSQPQRTGILGQSFDSELAPSSLFLIAPILRAANEIESIHHGVARLCRFYALEEARKLDPLSAGRGVRQFKTALERRLKRGNNEKPMDSVDMKIFYQYFHGNYIEPLEDAVDKSDKAQRIKAYETSHVLFELFQYLKEAESIAVDPEEGVIPDEVCPAGWKPEEILQVQDKVVSRTSLPTPAVSSPRTLPSTSLCSGFSHLGSLTSSRSVSHSNFAVKAQANDLPLVGNKAPDFEAKAVFDQEVIKVKLSEYIGKKYVILFFYPLDFTLVFPTEITSFSDHYEEFEKLNTQVLGVSVDTVFSYLGAVQKDRKSGGLGDLNYPLVSDITTSISKSFGVFIPDQGVALRGFFIIDKEGVIKHSTINKLQGFDETMKTLQALLYVQEKPWGMPWGMEAWGRNL